MCGPLFWGAAWGFWWVFPLMGLVMCLAMMFLFGRMGGGCMGIGGHRTTQREQVGETRQ